MTLPNISPDINISPGPVEKATDESINATNGETPAPANVSFAPGLIALTSLDSLKIEFATGTSCSGPECCV